jgi:hypothetical protein
MKNLLQILERKRTELFPSSLAMPTRRLSRTSMFIGETRKSIKLDIEVGGQMLQKVQNQESDKVRLENWR